MQIENRLQYSVSVTARRAVRIGARYLCAVAIVVIACGTLAAQDLYSGEPPAVLQERRALLIGVGPLLHGTGFLPLSNPPSDVTRVAKALAKRGFKISNLNEKLGNRALTRSAIKNAIYDMVLLLKDQTSVGLVYFAGHGIERAGRRYLVPYDANVRYERDLEDELISLEFITEAMKVAGNPLNIIVLDTCRDNPLRDKLQRFGTEPRAEARPTYREPENVVIFNSTLQGKRATDGAGKVSPFAEKFAEFIANPDEGMLDTFDKIARKFRVKFPGQVPNATVKGIGFVFAPTKKTFVREECLWRRTRAQGWVSAINEFMLNNTGGYFYASAKRYKEQGGDNQPFDATPDCPALVQATDALTSPLEQPAQHATSGQAVATPGVLTLNKKWNLRDAPAGNIVDTLVPGSRVVAVGLPIKRSSSNWIPIDRDGKTVFAEAKGFASLMNLQGFRHVLPAEIGPTVGNTMSEVVRKVFTRNKDFSVLLAEKGAKVVEIEVRVAKPEDPVSRRKALETALAAAALLAKKGIDISHAKLAIKGQKANAEHLALGFSYWGKI